MRDPLSTEQLIKKIINSVQGIYEALGFEALHAVSCMFYCSVLRASVRLLTLKHSWLCALPGNAGLSERRL